MGRHAPVLVFVVGLAATLVGDQVVRLDPALHHAGWQHAFHTVLLAVPAGILVALLMRDGRVGWAALWAGAGWAAAMLVLAML